MDTLRIRPLAALRAIRALHENPEDTSQVFRVIEALSGRHILRMMRRFSERPEGARLLRERPRLLETLSDVERLRQLPEGSLGRAYLAFLESEGITAQGLVDASLEGRKPREPDIDFVRDRMRDQHDLWHVVTGYKGDLIGEAALLAFSFAQTRNLGIAVIVLSALLRRRQVGLRPVVSRAFLRGVRAAWLPAADWESLLPLPLDEVRHRLKIDAPPTYTPVRTAEYLEAMAA